MSHPRFGRPRTALLAAAVFMGVLAACSGGKSQRVAGVGDGSTTSTSEATTTTSSSPPSTSTTTSSTTTTTRAPLPGMGPGARGPEVLALEQKLDALRYDVGTVNDVYDAVTAHAVTAFQKVHGFGRTGRATEEIVAAANRTNTPPAAMVPGGGFTRVEVDVPRQVLFLYEGNSLFRILPVSTGNNQRFCSEGYCRKAVTPGGSFATYRKARGWEKSPLGRLYNPVYFNGGIAIHGALSVPAYPASHGCVRIPMNAAEWFPTKVGLGIPVYVIGAKGENPAPLPPTTLPPVTAPTTVLPPVTATIPTPPTTSAPVPTTPSTLFPFTIPTEPF